MNATFQIFVFLPTFALVYTVLAMLYDSERAYLALSWIPATSLIIINLLARFSTFWRTADDLPGTLIYVVAWIGLAQFLLGIVLAFRAAWLKEDFFTILLTSLLPIIPFVWWLTK